MIQKLASETLFSVQLCMGTYSYGYTVGYSNLTLSKSGKGHGSTSQNPSSRLTYKIRCVLTIRCKQVPSFPKAVVTCTISLQGN